LGQFIDDEWENKYSNRPLNQTQVEEKPTMRALLVRFQGHFGNNITHACFSKV